MIRRLLFLLTIAIAVFSVADAQNADVFSVKKYGAKADGKTLDGIAINKAIAAAAAKGGGTVYFPAGNYLTGSIHLQSNVSLYIEQGATLIAAAVNAANGYDEEEPGANNQYQDAGHSHWHNSLIWGDSLHDVSILGLGLINGNALYKDWAHGNKQSANKAIALRLCRNVTIRDISILHGGWFAILATGIDNFTLDNVKFDTNRDGVDVDGCRNVRISNCYVNSPYDDGICLKSSFALGYAKATENVTITNCQVSGYDEGTLLDGTFKRTENPMYHLTPTGRIKFGTESNGDFKNITISNCVFDYCRGLALESVDGSHIEDVSITNITMRDIVNDPIFIRLGSRMRGPSGTQVGEIRRVIISNIVVHGAAAPYGCTITGIPGHEIEDITLSNIRLYANGGGNQSQSDTIPEKANQYPEPGMFGANPAYGLFVRHAKNINIADAEFNLIQADQRPALRFDDVKGLYLFHVTPQVIAGVKPMVMNNVEGVEIAESKELEK